MIYDHRLARTPVEDVLCCGMDDWNDPGTFYSLAVTHLHLVDHLDRLRYAMGLAAEMVLAGLLEVGDVREHQFIVRSGDPAEVVGRFLSEWMAWDYGQGFPMPGDLMWFNNTPAGNKIAEARLAVEGWFPDPERPGKWIKRTTDTA